MQLNVSVEDADGRPLDAGWDIDVDVRPVADGEHDVRVRVRYDGAAAVDARVRVETPVPGTHPHWLIPGLFYGDNRDPACIRLYPRYAPGSPDAEDLTSDHWAFRADRSATPAVFGWGPSGGVALEVDANTSLGLSGLGLGAGPDRPASIWVSLPYREEPFSYVGEPHGVPALAESHRWEPGEVQELRVGL